MSVNLYFPPAYVHQLVWELLTKDSCTERGLRFENASSLEQELGTEFLQTYFKSVYQVFGLSEHSWLLSSSFFPSLNKL